MRSPRTRLVFHWALLALLVCMPVRLIAQCEGEDGLTWEFGEEESGFSIGRLLGSLVTPQLIQDTRAIRAYVRDPRFGVLLRRCGDLRAVDALYQKALRVAEYDIARALFLSMVASLEHQNIGVQFPVVGTVSMPLTFEEDSLFHQRIRNLPSRIYHDSPQDAQGDKDKLQHFFGSAYLAHISESPELARSAGNFVEWGEAQMIVGGVDDIRDKRANKQGETFGHDLLYVKTLLPSDYLTLPVKDEEPTE